MFRVSIHLVGRASELRFFSLDETGDGMVSFRLTVKDSGQNNLVYHCVGNGKEIAEQFEQMDEGCLVSVMGKLSTPSACLRLISIDRLEYLGEPLEAMA